MLIPNNIIAPPKNTCFVGSSPSKKIAVTNKFEQIILKLLWVSYKQLGITRTNIKNNELNA